MLGCLGKDTVASTGSPSWLGNSNPDLLASLLPVTLAMPFTHEPAVMAMWFSHKQCCSDVFGGGVY